MISRDVIFEEEKKWNWDWSDEEQNVFDLELEDNKNGSEEDNSEENEVGTEASEEDSLTPNEENLVANTTSPTTEPRDRRALAWMNEYVSGKGLSEEEEDVQTHFVLFTNSDPMSFDEAVKDEQWRTAMDSEMSSIKKNETWDLVDLPK